jgi:hypothetical protein
LNKQGGESGDIAAPGLRILKVAIRSEAGMGLEILAGGCKDCAVAVVGGANGSESYSPFCVMISIGEAVFSAHEVPPASHISCVSGFHFHSQLRRVFSIVGSRFNSEGLDDTGMAEISTIGFILLFSGPADAVERWRIGDTSRSPSLLLLARLESSAAPFKAPGRRPKLAEGDTL